jgi:hypothetical protein
MCAPAIGPGAAAEFDQAAGISTIALRSVPVVGPITR